jgi:CDP-glucose 4,6-dehydratase
MARQPEVVGQAFNFSTEMQVTALEMVQRILRLMGSELQPDIRAEARHEIPHQYLSAAKARSALAWQPRYELDDALRETIAWYQTYFATQPAWRAAQAA